MQYVGICFSGITLILILFMFVIEGLDRNQKKRFFNFKTPLHYFDAGSGSIENIFSIIGQVIYIVFALGLVLIKINAENSQYCDIILGQINSIESIMMAFFAVVVSVIIFSVTLGPKEYYLSRTREEINRDFGIHVVFQILSVCSTISVICTFFLQKTEFSQISDCIIFTIWEICCCALVFLGAYGLIIIGMLTLGSSRVELYSLNKLYRRLWDNSILKLVNETENVIYINLGYLLKRYIKLKYIKKERGIKEIKYIRDIESVEKWRKYAVCCLAMWLIIFVIISGTILLIDKKYMLLITTGLVSGGCIFFLYNRYTAKITNKYVAGMLLGRSGFLVKKGDGGKKEEYIGNVSLINNFHGQKYIQSICNMMVLYCIVCSCWKKDNSEIIKKSFEDMIAYIKENDDGNEGFNKALRYVPVFVCGYYFFVYFGKEEFPEAIIELYNAFGLTNEEKKRYYMVINSFIAYASQYRPSSIDYENAKNGYWNINYYDRYIEKNGYSQLFKGLQCS